MQVPFMAGSRGAQPRRSVERSAMALPMWFARPP